MDVYIFLFVAFTILIFHIEPMLKDRSVSEFLFMPKEFGLSDGTYALAVQSLSIATIFFPFVWITNFDIYAFILLSIGIFFIYYFVHKLLFDERSRNMTIESSLKDHSTENSWKSFFYVGSNLLHLYVQLLFVSTLCSIFFPSHHGLSFSLFTMFTFLYFGIGGVYGQQKINVSIFFFLYFLLVSVIFVFYMKFGTQTIMENYEFQSFRVIHFNFVQQVQSIVVFVLVILGLMISNDQFSTSFHTINQKHRLSAVRFSSFAVAALYFAVAVLTVFYVGQFDHLSIDVLIREHAYMLQIIIFIIFSVISIGIGHSIFSIVKGVYLAIGDGRNSFSTRNVQRVYVSELIGISALGVVAFFHTSSIQLWLNIWIVVISSIAISFILFILHRKSSVNDAMANSVLSMGMGFILSIMLNDMMNALAITLLISFVLHVSITKFKIFRKK